jgi:plasmid stability protein
MATITVRRLDPNTKARLRVRAAQHGRSMEAEAREILKAALADESMRRRNLAARIRARFKHFGGVDLPAIPREPMRRPPVLEK